MTTNGSYDYSAPADIPGGESSYERAMRERFWRSLGKRVRKCAR